MANNINNEAYDRQMLQQELTVSRENLDKAYKDLIELLPWWEGQPDTKRESFSPPVDVLRCQRIISVMETELYNIQDIIERLFWLPIQLQEE